MRYVHTAGVALIGALAICAVGSSAASARCAVVWTNEPATYRSQLCSANGSHPREFAKVLAGLIISGVQECAKVELGTESSKYSDDKCQTPSNGTGEYIKVLSTPVQMGPMVNGIPNVSFDGKGSSIKLNTGAGQSISCSKEESKGETTSESNVGLLVITLTKCTGKEGATECEVNSTSAKAGEIVTKPLAGELGLVAKAEATSTVGLVLEPETGKRLFVLSKATCLPETSVEGSIAGEITPVDRSAKTVKLVFALEGGNEKIKHLTVKGETTVKSPELFAFGNEATESETDEITFAEVLEVT